MSLPAEPLPLSIDVTMSLSLGMISLTLLTVVLAGGDDVRDRGDVFGAELVAILNLGAGGELAVDVDHRVAEDAGGLQRDDGVLVDAGAEVRRELHHDLDGRELARGVGGDLDVGDLADGDAFERDGSADLDAGGVVKEGVDDDALLEEADAGGAGHEEEQRA